MNITYADVVKSTTQNKSKFGFISNENGNVIFGKKTYDNYNDAKKKFYKFITKFGDHAELVTNYYASLETGASGITFLLTDDFDNLKKDIEDIQNNGDIEPFDRKFYITDTIIKYFRNMRKN